MIALIGGVVSFQGFNFSVRFQHECALERMYTVVLCGWPVVGVVK